MVASGVLVVLSFPRYGHGLGLDGLVFVAFLPFFLAATSVGGRRGALLGWCAGLVIEGAGFLWLLFAFRAFTSSGSVLMSLVFGAWLLYSSVPWVLMGAALGACRRASGVLLVLLFWVGFEHYFPRLFLWHLGGALYGRTVLVQCVDLLGTSALSAVVLLANAVLFFSVRWFLLRGTDSEWARPPWRSAAALITIGVAIGVYGTLRLEEVRQAESTAPATTVLLVQGFLGPNRDTDDFEHTQGFSDSLDYYLATTRKTLDALSPEEAAEVSWIVWPEGADSSLFGLSPGLDPWLAGAAPGHRREQIARFEGLLRTPPSRAGRVLLTGGAGYHEEHLPPMSNVTAFLRDGSPPIFYAKNVLMPFGERTPFIDLVPDGIRKRLGLDHIGNLFPGRDNPLIEVGDGSRFRQLICYEAVLPGYLRRSAQGADFLVNVTEDIWYGNTAHIPQHASVLLLRALENRVPVVRCTNVGPSGIFRMTGELDTGEEIFRPARVLKTFRPKRLNTIYARGGYLFPLGCLLTAGGVAIWRWRRRKS